MATTSYGSPYVSGSDLVAAWPAASLTVANAIDAAGYYIGRGINAQTASYVGVLTDAGKTVTMTVATSNTFTVPLNATVAYPTGTRINILNLGAGACTVTATGGVTISGTIAALAQNGAAAIVKTGTNTWSYLPFDSGTPTLTSADVSGTTGLAAGYPQTSGANTIYLWNGSGTFVTSKAGLCTAIVVGGGAGGDAGGGGAGAMLVGTSVFLPSGTNTVTIGAGGATKVNGITSRLAQYYAQGGGGAAGGGSSFARVGGSGGGGYLTGAVTAGGTGTPSLGNNGGNGASNAGGGGGGAGAVGAVATGNTGGAGGAGTASSITGSSVTYAGGGGGSGTVTGGAGGAGGGGAGSTGTGGAGSANLGGGGGGGDVAGNSGGSGICVISVTT
jgi:hypothetical protein